MRLVRRLRAPAVCLGLALLIGLAAIGDHIEKNRRIHSGEVNQWYCEHEGTRCAGASWHGIESDWQARQVGYEIAVAGLGSVAIVLGALRLTGGRRVRAG
jgi:hypothetical protein